MLIQVAFIGYYRTFSIFEDEIEIKNANKSTETEVVSVICDELGALF